MKDCIEKEDLVFFSLIEKRRSIRKFLDKPVETQKIDKIMEAALRAPSSRGFNPWEFIFVTDQTVLGQLSKSKPHGSSFLKNAALGIVVLADEKKTSCNTKKYIIINTSNQWLHMRRKYEKHCLFYRPERRPERKPDLQTRQAD